MTIDDAVNDWDLGSGFDLDGAKVEITKCEFGPNNEIAAGIICANMEFTPLDGSEPQDQSFSVGKGFESDRTGENLVTENGKQRKLNMQSNFGVLLSSALDCIAGPKEDDESDAAYHQRRMEAGAEILGSPRHGPNWVGTMWQLGTVTREVMNPTTKAKKEGIRFIFTEWLGSSPDAGAEKTTSKAKSSSKSTSRTTKVGGGKSDTAPDGIDDEMWTTLVDLAVEVMGRDESNEHEHFMNEAMDNVEGVDTNKAAQKACMGTRAGSVWAAAEKKFKASK